MDQVSKSLKPIHKWKIWIQAFRLRTLPLAFACIGMGGFLAAYQHKFEWDIFLLTLLTTLFLQILSNLANDYGDAMHGVDSLEREGPSRTVQSGKISSVAMKRALYVFSFISFSTGVLLLFTAFGYNIKVLLLFLSLGLLSILAAIAYTVGKKPYGYAGLGDISVFIFFGLVGVLGAMYLFTLELNFYYIWPALSCGFFSMAVLNVNNIRDIESDRKAGKRSIPVRIGRKRAVYYHWVLLFSGMTSAVVFMLQLEPGWHKWLFLISFPFLIYNGYNIFRHQSAAKLDPYLKQMAISTLIFVITFGVGLMFAD